MHPSRIKIGMRGLLLIIALVAIPLAWAADETRLRRDRRLDLAHRHLRVGAEYRRNARMLAEESGVWGPIPESSPFPPRGWASPTIR
jgi:hypothetical protein